MKKKTNQNPSKQAVTSQETAGKGTQTYLKYSGLAFQMLGTVGLAAWGGIKLDDYLGYRFPWFTVSLTMLALVGTVIWLVRQLPKD